MITIPGHNGGYGLALDEPTLTSVQQKVALAIALAGKPMATWEITDHLPAYGPVMVLKIVDDLRRLWVVWSEGFRDKMIRLARPLRWREVP